MVLRLQRGLGIVLISGAAALAALLSSPARSADAANLHIPLPPGPIPTDDSRRDSGPAFSAAVLAGDTLYISGSIDLDPATGKPPADPKAGARIILDGMQRVLARAGMTMDDLVWVQIFTADLANYSIFNEVYRTYFKGPVPARAFVGAGSLLAGAHFEVMGIARKPGASR